MKRMLRRYQTPIVIFSLLLFIGITFLRVRYGFITDGKQFNPSYKWQFSPSPASIILYVAVWIAIFLFAKKGEQLSRAQKALLLFLLTVLVLFATFSLNPGIDKWTNSENYYQLARYMKDTGVINSLHAYNTLYNGNTAHLEETKELAKKYHLYSFFKNQLETDNTLKYERVALYPPLMSLYLVPFLYIHESRLSALTGIILGSALTILLFYVLMSRIFSEALTFRMSLLFLSMPSFILHTIEPFPEPLMTLPFVIGMYFYLKARKTGNHFSFLFAGVLFAITFYVKFTLIVMLLPLGLFLILDRNWKGILSMGFGFFLPVILFEALNYHFLLTFLSAKITQSHFFRGTISKNLLLQFIFNPLGIYYNLGVVIWILVGDSLLHVKKKITTFTYVGTTLFFILLFLIGDLGRFLIPFFLFFFIIVAENLGRITRKTTLLGLISHLILTICWVIL